MQIIDVAPELRFCQVCTESVRYVDTQLDSSMRCTLRRRIYESIGIGVNLDYAYRYALILHRIDLSLAFQLLCFIKDEKQYGFDKTYYTWVTDTRAVLFFISQSSFLGYSHDEANINQTTDNAIMLLLRCFILQSPTGYDRRNETGFGVVSIAICITSADWMNIDLLCLPVLTQN